MSPIPQESFTNLPALTQILLLSWDLYSVQSTCFPSVLLSPPRFRSATCTPPTITLRQAGLWDPLLWCCNACAWTHLSPSNRIQRNCVGLKITACLHSWGESWTSKIQRDQKAQLPFLRSLEQKQDTVHAPYTHHHLGVGKTPKPRLQPDPWTCPASHPV